MVPAGCENGTQVMYLIDYFHFFTTTKLPPPPTLSAYIHNRLPGDAVSDNFPDFRLYLRPCVFEQRVHGDTIPGAYEIICLSGQLYVRVAVQVRLFLP